MYKQYTIVSIFVILIIFVSIFWDLFRGLFSKLETFTDFDIGIFKAYIDHIHQGDLYPCFMYDLSNCPSEKCEIKNNNCIPKPRSESVSNCSILTGYGKDYCKNTVNDSTEDKTECIYNEDIEQCLNNENEYNDTHHTNSCFLQPTSQSSLPTHCTKQADGIIYPKNMDDMDNMRTCQEIDSQIKFYSNTGESNRTYLKQRCNNNSKCRLLKYDRIGNDVPIMKCINNSDTDKLPSYLISKEGDCKKRNIWDDNNKKCVNAALECKYLTEEHCSKRDDCLLSTISTDKKICKDLNDKFDNIKKQINTIHEKEIEKYTQIHNIEDQLKDVLNNLQTHLLEKPT